MSDRKIVRRQPVITAAQAASRGTNFLWHECALAYLSANPTFAYVAAVLWQRENFQGQGFFATDAQIAAETGLHTDTVARARRRLTEGGYLEVLAQGGRGRPSKYQLVLPADAYVVAEKPGMIEHHASEATADEAGSDPSPVDQPTVDDVWAIAARRHAQRDKADPVQRRLQEIAAATTEDELSNFPPIYRAAVEERRLELALQEL